MEEGQAKNDMQTVQNIQRYLNNVLYDVLEDKKNIQEYYVAINNQCIAKINQCYAIIQANSNLTDNEGNYYDNTSVTSMQQARLNALQAELNMLNNVYASKFGILTQIIQNLEVYISKIDSYLTVVSNAIILYNSSSLQNKQSSGENVKTLQNEGQTSESKLEKIEQVVKTGKNVIDISGAKTMKTTLAKGSKSIRYQQLSSKVAEISSSKMIHAYSTKAIARRIENKEELQALADTIRTSSENREENIQVFLNSVGRAGGTYEELRSMVKTYNLGKQIEVHHIPPRSVVQFVSPYKSFKNKNITNKKGDFSVAIAMSKHDHTYTASYDHKKGSSNFRKMQSELVKANKYDDALMNEIRDITSNFGDKYNYAIGQACERYIGLKENF